MSPLISAQALRDRLDQPAPLLVLDCRFNLAQPEAGAAAHAQGHVPGAHHAHLDRDLSGPKTGLNGRHPLPDIPAFAHTLRQWGLNPGTHVVAYDDAGGMFAARLWWMLRWLGHDAVQVLDGGWRAWLALPGPIEVTQAPPPLLGFFEPQPRPALLRRTADVQAHLDQPQAQLIVDARAPDRFRGDNETLDPVGGHIPGARNRFFQLNLQANGLFKSPEQLHNEFVALLAGQAPDTVVHQCGSGVTACHNLLAMSHAGMAGSSLYAGSWSEWCAEPQRPVTSG